MSTTPFNIYYLPFYFRDLSLEDQLQGLRLQKSRGFTHVSDEEIVPFAGQKWTIDEYIYGTENHWQDEEEEEESEPMTEWEDDKSPYLRHEGRVMPDFEERYED
jgi:hypothetical protein